jgi:hypothetical protein
MNDSRVRMSDAGNTDTREKIEILLAVLIDDHTAMRTLHLNTHWFGRGLTNVT